MESKTKAKAKTKKENVAPVVSTLIIRQPQRKTSDVAVWRNALVSADGGRISSLYNLYDDLLIDGVLSDAHQKRIEAVTNAELIFQDPRGKNVPVVTAIMETLDWEVMLREFEQPVFWGRSGVEFDFSGDGFRATALPRKHISLETGRILVEEGGEAGIDYMGNDLLLVLGQKREWGLFLKTAPYVIWKRGGFGDWAQWLEIFGMPQRVGKYNIYDPQSRILLEDALKNAGAAPWCVIPEGSSIEEVKTAGSGSSSASYGEFRVACNEEVLITILGQTLTTISGDKGARSLGEVHKKVEEGKNKADMRYVEKVLNTCLVPRLEKRGFPVKGGRFVFPAATQDLKVSEIVSLSTILPIPTAYLYDKYGIPVPQKGEQVAGENTADTREKEPSGEGEKEGKGDKPKIKEKTGKSKDDKADRALDDRSLAVRLVDALRDFFVNAPDGASGAAEFTGRLRNSTTTRLSSESSDINIDAIVRRAVREIYGDRGESLINSHLFNITNDALQRGIDTELKETAKTNPDFVREFKENAAVFAAFKNHCQTKEIVALLYDEDGKLKPFYKFRREALELSKDYNVKWLQTEYNTAVRAARMAANMKRYRATAHIYPNLEYMATTASQPRDTHLTYVGTILPVDHQWWDTHLPPSDWNCACSVRPTDKPATPVPDGEYVNAIFRNNPELTKEFVNIKKTPYYKHTADDLHKEIRDASERLLRASKEKMTGVYEGKDGGYLKIVRQDKREMENNLITYKMMADVGGRYSLLNEIKGDNIKNPDALNLKTMRYSDAKHPESKNGQRAIQNAMSNAAEQGVEEVIIRLQMEYPSRELYNGLRASLQNGRCKTIREIVLLRVNQKPLFLDVDKLRERFWKK
jgi:hypothetical protein